VEGKHTRRSVMKRRGPSARAQSHVQGEEESGEEESHRRWRLSWPWFVPLCVAVAATALVVSLATGILGPGGKSGPEPNSSPDSHNSTPSPSESVFAAINDLRAQNGLRPLIFSASAARIARRHSVALATRDNRLPDDCLDCIAWQMRWVNAQVITGTGKSIQAVNQRLTGGRARSAGLLCRCVTMGAAGVVQADGRFWVTELSFRPAPPVLFGARAKPRPTDKVVTGNVDEDALIHLESEIGRKLAIDHFYLNFGEVWPNARFAWDRRGGRVPLMDWDLTDPTYTWAQIAAGKADGIINARARAAAAYKGPILLSFDHEPNYSTAGTPSQFVAAWKHIVNKFRAARAANVKFVLIISAIAFDQGTQNLWYPGRTYVDYVGADGYNWYGAHSNARWRTLGDIFTNFYYWTITEHVPAMITETGCLEDPRNPGRKAAWFRQADTWLHSRPNIKAFVYFDTNQRWPWWVDTSTQSLNAFKAMAHNPLFR
jgi:hypothetical protein